MSAGLRQARSHIWRTDPLTLREVVLDRPAMEARLGECPPPERIWILCLLDRAPEAVAEGLDLLAGASDRFRPLLVLAHAYQRQGRHGEAARLQEEALCLARTRSREAMVRRQIGLRLFDQAQYEEAAAEFEWACDLYRSTGHREQLSRTCQQARDRAWALSGNPAQSAGHPTSQDSA